MTGQEGNDEGESYRMTADEVENAKKELARQRRRLGRKARKKMKKLGKHARYKVARCRINAEWRDSGMVNVYQTREKPDGRYVLNAMLVDLGCLGPKNVTFAQDVTRAKVNSYEAGFDSEMIDCDPHLAAKIVRKGALLRVHLGFPMSDEFSPVMALFQRYDPEKSDEEVPLGKDGKPLYVAGPHDDAREIIDHLTDRLGSDGFHFIAPAF